MSKHAHHHPSKRKAVQAVLERLGWHASGKDVVALLANYGIDASEGLVHKIKVDALKKSDEVRRLRARSRNTVQRPDRQAARKVPRQGTKKR